MTVGRIEVLVKDFIEGNQFAFEQLVNSSYNYCLERAKSLVKDEELAKDLLQEALIQAFVNIEKLKNKAAFRSWLAGIVRNVCLNHLRSNSNYFIPIEEINESLFLGENEVDEGEEELKEHLRRAIDRLNEDNRQLIKDFYYNGKSIKEISRLKDISISTVKVRLFRARKQLEKLFVQNLASGNVLELWTEEVKWIPWLGKKKQNFVCAA